MSEIIKIVSIIITLALGWMIYNNSQQENKQLMMGLLALQFILILLDLIV